jgi:SRSO17 transposase
MAPVGHRAQDRLAGGRAVWRRAALSDAVATGRSQWDADRLQDEVRDYVVESLGDADGVLIVDETGFVKKGEGFADVARQCSGTTGRVENCQIGVFLAYASRYGQALIDRRPDLPENWTQDRARCAKASIPETVEFATKPKMARSMIQAAVEAGVPCAYVLGIRSTARTAVFAGYLRPGINPTDQRFEF